MVLTVCSMYKLKHSYFLFCSVELQKFIEEKSNELAKKTEELKARSPQAQRREYNIHLILIRF